MIMWFFSFSPAVECYRGFVPREKRTMNTRHSWIVIVLATALPIAGPTAAAAPAPIVPALAPSQPQGPTDPAELEAFLDELLARQMEENHIPGGAVAVVRDGEVLLAKGYGYADLENGVPVDPELTVFRIGSSGKVFTWTAVMQLVEQGKLDLNVDINTYLDFRVPDTYPRPITLEHLLTHKIGRASCRERV